MGLELKWVGADMRDVVARARLQAFAASAALLPTYRQWIEGDDRADDFLLATEGDEVVGTSTHLPMTMWVRGAALPCQGVAWVGTSRTRRRSSGRFGGKGVASHMMEAVVRRGRERGDVLSALHPFSCGFYEQFGYGVVERRAEWTLPVRVMPAGSIGSLRYFRPDDAPGMAQCLSRANLAGQADVERSPGRWATLLNEWADGWTVVDADRAGGPVRGYLHFTQRAAEGSMLAVVDEIVYENVPALVRQLRFLSSLRDQCAAAVVTLPADVPVNLLLREPQIRKDFSTHPIASLRTYNRMQLRVLDHKRLLEAVAWPAALKGSAVVGVQESEGRLTRFTVDVSDGHATVSPCTHAPETAISDNTWAQIATGELSATRARDMGLIAVDKATCLTVLDALSTGPAPFCHEDF